MKEEIVLIHGLNGEGKSKTPAAPCLSSIHEQLTEQVETCRIVVKAWHSGHNLKQFCFFNCVPFCATVVETSQLGSKKNPPGQAGAVSGNEPKTARRRSQAHPGGRSIGPGRPCGCPRCPCLVPPSMSILSEKFRLTFMRGVESDTEHAIRERHHRCPIFKSDGQHR